MRDEKYICHTVPALLPITILQKTEKIYIVLSKETSRKKFVGSFTFINLVSSIKLGSNWISLMSYC